MSMLARRHADRCTDQRPLDSIHRRTSSINARVVVGAVSMRRRRVWVQPPRRFPATCSRATSDICYVVEDACHCQLQLVQVVVRCVSRIHEQQRRAQTPLEVYCVDLLDVAVLVTESSRFVPKPRQDTCVTALKRPSWILIAMLNFYCERELA